MTQQGPLQAPNRPCPCHLTPRPETHPPAGTCPSASAASGRPWSSTALGRGLALRFEPSESIWETVTSTLFTTWSGYVFPCNNYQSKSLSVIVAPDKMVAWSLILICGCVFISTVCWGRQSSSWGRTKGWWPHHPRQRRVSPGTCPHWGGWAPA